MGHVVLHCEAYTTNRFARHGNREVRFRFITNDAVEPVAGIADLVGIGKTIAQVDRDSAVVRMMHNRIAIPPLPTSHTTPCQLQIHVVCIRGNTAAPRGIMYPLPLPACSSASGIVCTGIIRIRSTASRGSSETKQTRKRSAFVKRAQAVCPLTS